MKHLYSDMDGYGLKIGEFILSVFRKPLKILWKVMCVNELTFSTYKVIQKYVVSKKLVVAPLERYGVSPPGEQNGGGVDYFIASSPRYSLSRGRTTAFLLD